MSDSLANKSARLLQFLQSEEDVQVSAFQGGKKADCLLTQQCGKRHLSTFAVLDALHKAALVSRHEGVCRISETGLKHLKRALNQNLENDPGGFGAQHRDLQSQKARVRGAEQDVIVNHNESPLSRLMFVKTKSGQPWLNPEAFGAAERLRTDFTKGQFLQRVTSSWDPTNRSQSSGGAGGMVDMRNSAIDARSRVDRALSLVGPELAGVLMDVCCFLKGLQTVERERNWPPRSAKSMLRVGLNLLVKHYGTSTGNTTTKERSWMGQGARPSL